MPYEKGHQYHPPKDGKMPGLSPAQRKAKRQLSAAVQERMPAELLVEWHLVIASGQTPRLVLDDERVPVGIKVDEHGIEPALEQCTRSINWLADRGHGLPAQKHHIDAELRAIGVSAQVTVDGRLSPAAMRAMRALMRGQLQPPADPSAGDPVTSDQASDDAQDAQDAEFVNVREPAPGDGASDASDA